MEILGAADACFMVGDDLFDFTLHGEVKEDFHLTTSSSSSSFPAAAAAAFGDKSLSGSFPVFEEELEWLSNKDEFPGVETCFGILSDNPELLLSDHSPSSVLENSSSSSSNSNSNSSDGNGSLKIPARPRSKGRRRRRRASYGELPDQAMWLSQVAIKYKQESLTMMNGGGRMGRRCLHCQSDKTPQWRAGPMGPKTLCNACGVRYKSGRLLPEYRPANSPTFSTKLHSNSHRRVVEMRRQTTELGGGSILG